MQCVGRSSRDASPVPVTAAVASGSGSSTGESGHLANTRLSGALHQRGPRSEVGSRSHDAWPSSDRAFAPATSVVVSRHQLRRAFWSCTGELGRVPADGSSCRVDRRGATLKGRLLAAVLAVSGRAVFCGDPARDARCSGSRLIAGRPRNAVQRRGACPPRSPYDRARLRGHDARRGRPISRRWQVKFVLPGFPTAPNRRIRSRAPRDPRAHD